MRTALILSGLTRSLHYSWLFTDKYLKQPLNADVFLHTWDIDNGGVRSKDLEVNAPSSLNCPKEEFIINEMKPVKYKIESYSSFDFSKGDLSLNILRQASSIAQYYGILQANNLKKEYENNNGFVYDLVIRARMDSFFEEVIPEKDITEAIRENILFVSCNCEQKDYPHIHTTDVFAFSTSKIMDIYAETFHLFREGPHSELLGERALHRQLGENKIKVKWCPIKFKNLTKWTTTEVRVEKANFS